MSYAERVSSGNFAFHQLVDGRWEVLELDSDPFRPPWRRVAVVSCSSCIRQCRRSCEIDRDLAVFARAGNGAMIVTTGGIAYHRNLVIRLAASHNLPAIYPFRYYAVDGGLMSYGPDTRDPIRSAAAYVDRILKGEKPSDMPVQAPTKYELVINLKTAKAFGITVPPSLLARANEVIE